MRSSISHLNAGQQKTILQIERLIRRHATPEIIILARSHAVARQQISGRADSSISIVSNTIEFLVITKKNEKRQAHEIENAVMDRCLNLFSGIDVSIQVASVDHVNLKLKEGDYFFCRLHSDGILLFDSGACRIVDPADIDYSTTFTKAEQDFDRWFSQARGFLAAAKFILDEKRYNISMFFLHQAAESAYQGIICVNGGSKPTTHNLNKLRVLCNKYSVDLALLFVGDNKEEKHYFKTLADAYIDARYNVDYKIKATQVERTLNLVFALLSIGERISSSRLKMLRELITPLN
jgi:uncharacterized protein